MSPPMAVTEDTPADMLAGSMDLHIVLPSGHVVRTSVLRSTPMMDLLVQVTTAHRLSPGSHSLQAMGERGALPFKPSTPIGALDTFTVRIVQKKSGLFKKAPQIPEVLPHTFRLQVHLPRSQLFVMRVTPQVLIRDVLKQVCKEKNLDPVKYELRKTGTMSQLLESENTLGEVQTQELTLVVRGTDHVRSLSSADIMHVKQANNRDHSVCDSSLSSGSLGSRSVSPVVAPAPQPPTRKKRRPAPKPPENLTRSVVISHSRESSDSSGYHEPSTLSESPTHNGPPSDISSSARGLANNTRNSASMSNLTSIPSTRLNSSVSVSSLSSNGPSKKKRAPPPPIVQPVPEETKQKSATLPADSRRQPDPIPPPPVELAPSPPPTPGNASPTSLTQALDDALQSLDDELGDSSDDDFNDTASPNFGWGGGGISREPSFSSNPPPPKLTPVHLTAIAGFGMNVRCKPVVAKTREEIMSSLHEELMEQIRNPKLRKVQQGKSNTVIPKALNILEPPPKSIIVDRGESKENWNDFLKGLNKILDDREDAKIPIPLARSNPTPKPAPRATLPKQASVDDEMEIVELPPIPEKTQPENPKPKNRNTMIPVIQKSVIDRSSIQHLHALDSVPEPVRMESPQPDSLSWEYQLPPPPTHFRDTCTPTSTVESLNGIYEDPVNEKLDQLSEPQKILVHKSEVMNELTNVLSRTRLQEKSQSFSNLYYPEAKNKLNHSQSFMNPPISNFKISNYEPRPAKTAEDVVFKKPELPAKKVRRADSMNIKRISLDKDALQLHFLEFLKERDIPVEFDDVSEILPSHVVVRDTKVEEEEEEVKEVIKTVVVEVKPVLEEKIQPVVKLNTEEAVRVEKIQPVVKLNTEEAVKVEKIEVQEKLEPVIRETKPLEKIQVETKPEVKPQKRQVWVPPAISMGTWGERPKTKITIKDEDYTTEVIVPEKQISDKPVDSKPFVQLKPIHDRISSPKKKPTNYERFSALSRKTDSDDEAETKQPPVICGVELKKEFRSEPDLIQGLETERLVKPDAQNFTKARLGLMPVVKGFRVLDHKKPEPVIKQESMPETVSVRVQPIRRQESLPVKCEGIPPPPPMGSVALRPVVQRPVKPKVCDDPRGELLEQIRAFGGLNRLRKTVQ